MQLKLSIRRHFFPLCILFILGALSGKGSPVPFGNIGIRNGGTIRYLDQLGLNANNLAWGPEAQGLRLGALLIPARDTGTIKEYTMILAIQNNSKTVMFIPVINTLPHYFSYSATDTSQKPLFHYAKDCSFCGPGLAELDPGKMAAFIHNYMPSFLDRVNKDHVPMIFSLDFEGLGGINPPDNEKNLVLKSGQVEFP